MISRNILLVEDSEDIYNIVHRTLGADYQVDWAPSFRVAQKLITEKKYDLILLDVVLPDGDGYQLCSLLQAQHETQNIPIIFLTSKNTVSDKVLGFSVGADDYIAKPFEPLELRARVETKFRKINRDRSRNETIKIGNVEINKESQRVSVVAASGKRDIDLTPIEFKLLLFLAKEENRVFSRDEILNGVWGEDIHVYNRSVDTHISKLRKKLENCSSYIQSVHGSGYKIAVDQQAPKVVSTGPTLLAF